MRGRMSAVVAVSALVVTACAQDQPRGQRGSNAEPTRGGTFVVALTEDPGHLNPAITTSGATHAAAELLYNGLLGEDVNGEQVPELAAELPEIEDGGAVYTFELRDDVQWHDGEAFTSDDVKFTFEKVLLKFHARTAASVGPALESIETPNETTVVFRFKEPYAPLKQQLNVTEAPILPEHVFAGSDPTTNPANTSPIGTGPFSFESYEQGSEIRYVANEDYFKQGLPFLDKVVMRIIPDPGTQILALQSGEVDWVAGVPGPDLQRLESDPAIELRATPWNPGGSNCIMTISFNLDNPIFQDARVRKAIALALERERFLEQILFGQGKVAEAPISGGIPWAHAQGLDMPQFDPEQATALLDEAGWKEQGDGARVADGVDGVSDGTKLVFDFLHFPTFDKYGELVRQQLDEVGIEVTQRPMEPAVFAPKVFEDRAFDTNVISYCNSSDPEIGVRRMYDSGQIKPIPFTNSSAYSNPEVDALFEQASQKLALDERGALYRDFQEIVVDELPYYWLVETVATRAYDAACSGFKFENGLFLEGVQCRK